MKKTLLLSSLTIILLALASCDWFTSPEELKPGRRDYVWTADTLDLVMNDFRSIWGSSPNDVWVGTFQNGEIFHYDGEKWEKHSEVGTSGYALYGFAENDVWIGGGDGRIWHYNGGNWEENFRYVEDKFKFATIRDFYGVNKNDFYAVGMTFADGYFNEWTENQRAFILHYNGFKWTEIFFADFQSQFIKILFCDNSYYILNVTVDNMYGDSTTVIEYESEENDLHTILIDDGNVAINQIDNQLVITMNDKILEYSSGNLIEKSIPPISDIFHQTYGRHKNDLLIRTRQNIAHYNGTDLVYLYSFNNEWTYSAGGAAVFEDEVFFCCSDYTNKIFFILKGKLN